MPYFTSWDTNLYLCLMSMGLHHDISLEMTRRIKKVHREHCLEESRSYYLDWKHWLPTTISKKDRRRQLFRQWFAPAHQRGDDAEEEIMGDMFVLSRKILLWAGAPIGAGSSGGERLCEAVYGRPELCIPNNFWVRTLLVNQEYKDRIRKIEPEERNDYFEWAYENHYHGWKISVLEWVKGFHPGRWILMDMKRGETLEDIRDLEDYGAYTEERFILKQNHIEDLFN